MKKRIAASLVLAFCCVIPQSAAAHQGKAEQLSPWQQHWQRHWNHQWDARWNRRWNVRFDARWRRQHPAPPPTAGWTWPWSCISQHEGSPPGNPATNTGNGFYGGLQFTMGTWLSNGGTGNPAAASIPEQEAVAWRVQRSQGWGAWPVSSAECGL